MENWVQYNPSVENHWDIPDSFPCRRPNLIIAALRLYSAFWCNQLWIVYYEPLKPSETITGERLNTTNPYESSNERQVVVIQQSTPKSDFAACQCSIPWVESGKKCSSGSSTRTRGISRRYSLWLLLVSINVNLIDIAIA